MGIVKEKKKTLSQIAYKYIKDQIVNGDLKDGEVITENSVGEILHMSRTPVKKAITQLETENYVKSIDGIGTIVIGLSLKDLADIYEVRIHMEALALKSAIDRIPKEKIEELMKMLENLNIDIKSGQKVDLEAITEVDRLVHSLILDYTTNSYVKVVMGLIKNQIGRYRYKAYELTDTSEDSIDFHLKILKGIYENDYEKASEVLKEHISWSFKEISKVLSISF